MTKRRWQWSCIAAVVGVFALSFFLPVVRSPFTSTQEYVLGWQACSAGWCVFWTLCLWGKGVLPTSRDLLESAFGWLPNLLFPLGTLLLVLRRNRSALILGIIAALAACIWLQDLQFGLYSGYFLWLASMVLLALAGGCFAFMANPKAVPNTSAHPSPPKLPDPSLLALFNQPRPTEPVPKEIRSSAPQGVHPSSLSAAMFPLFLNLTDRLVVVIGGGPVGRRKAAAALDAGARVRLVCLESRPADETLRRPRLAHRTLRPRSPRRRRPCLRRRHAGGERPRRRRRPGARRLGQLRLRPRGRRFLPPRRGPSRRLRRSPSAPAARPRPWRREVRRRLEEQFDDDFGRWVALLAEMRPLVLEGVRDAERRRLLFERWSQLGMAGAIAAGRAPTLCGRRCFGNCATECGATASPL